MQEKKLNLDRLKKLGSDIAEAKQSRAKVEGRIQSLEEQLLALGLDSISKAKDEIIRLTTEVEEMNLELARAIDTIEEKMSGNSV